MDSWGGAWGGAWGGSWGADAAIESAAPGLNGPDAPVSQLWLTDEQIRRQNELILLTVMSAVTGGMLG